MNDVKKLKNIYLYSVEHELMDKHAEELDTMDLPFNWRYIPIEYLETCNIKETQL